MRSADYPSGEPRDLSQEMTAVTTPLLPKDRPRYVMGVGMPDELPHYVAKGVDMMDCVLPTRNARNGYLFTSTGRVVIKQAQYADDAGSAGSRLRMLYLPEFLAGVSSPPIYGGGDTVLDAGDAAQHSLLL